MPLPKAPKKPADKLSTLPTTASEAAHSLHIRGAMPAKSIAKLASLPSENITSLVTPTLVNSARPDMRRNAPSNLKSKKPLQTMIAKNYKSV